MHGGGTAAGVSGGHIVEGGAGATVVFGKSVIFDRSIPSMMNGKMPAFV